MGVNAKHIATFLMGAAAGYAAYKYANMTEEEKEKMMADLKAKAEDLRKQAEGAADKARDYFDELRTQGSSAMKEQFGDLEQVMDELFGRKDEKPEPKASEG
jgi:ElaB/YqjD/DUF883 family membrane-anchored ribosome-binding protein